MPTYDYKCETCDDVTQIVQNITEDALTQCPKCGNKIYRLIGRNVGISFKGSGFYVNDSSSSSTK